MDSHTARTYSAAGRPQRTLGQARAVVIAPDPHLRGYRRAGPQVFI